MIDWDYERSRCWFPNWPEKHIETTEDTLVPVVSACSWCHTTTGPFISTDNELSRICGSCAEKFAQFLGDTR